YSGALCSRQVRRRLHGRNLAQFPGLLPSTLRLLMIYPIVKFGNPVLEKPAEKVTVFDEELKKLIEDMFESMYAARGVVLAATEIGISRRIAVVDVTFKEDPDAQLAPINPEINHKQGRHSRSVGCLSIPDFRENVSRAQVATVRAQDLTGNVFEKTADDLLAR